MIEVGRMRRVAGSAAVFGAAVAVGVPAATGHVGHAAAVQYKEPPKLGNVKLGNILFVAGCGGCHTLKAAGTKGTRAPNLAQEPSAYDALITQIKYGGEGMPAFGSAFTKLQIQSIARYVSSVTPYSAAGGGG